MKKIIKLLITIFILILFFELITFIFKTHHEITYNLKDQNETYKITEIYKNKKYYLKIDNKTYKYSFEINNTFHKRKKIIKKIYTYNIDKTKCIYPQTKNKENKETNIICSKDNKTYSYLNYQEKLTPFIKNLQKQGITSQSWKKQSNSTKSIETLSAYQKNINPNTHILIYKYNGFYNISNKSLEIIKLFKNDTYINTLGANIDRYYIIPNYNQKYDYNQLYVIDMKTGKVKTRDIKQKISKDSYINGIINNEIYLFDKDELKQYKISKKGKKVEEVGNKKQGVLYYNLKFETKDVYTFRDNNIKFKTTNDYIKQIEKNTSIKFIEKQNDTYYYVTKEGNVYYYNTNNKIKVLLFNKNIKDFKLIKETLFFIENDTLYSYSQQEGIKKLLTYKELSFNWDNRLAIYIE